VTAARRATRDDLPKAAPARSRTERTRERPVLAVGTPVEFKPTDGTWSDGIVEAHGSDGSYAIRTEYIKAHGIGVFSCLERDVPASSVWAKPR
jgi:hypothetical protein